MARGEVSETKNRDYPEIWAGDEERYIGEVDGDFVRILVNRVEMTGANERRQWTQNLLMMLKVYQALPDASLASMAEIYRSLLSHREYKGGEMTDEQFSKIFGKSKAELVDQGLRFRAQQTPRRTGWRRWLKSIGGR